MVVLLKDRFGLCKAINLGRESFEAVEPRPGWRVGAGGVVMVGCKEKTVTTGGRDVDSTSHIVE